MKKGTLKLAAINVNDSVTKSKFDNYYGSVSRSLTVSSVPPTSCLAVRSPSSPVSVMSERVAPSPLRGYGCRVIVTEIDPINALQASMAGYQSTSWTTLPRRPTSLSPTTGCRDIITGKHFEAMKDDAISATLVTSTLRSTLPGSSQRCQRQQHQAPGRPIHAQERQAHHPARREAVSSTSDAPPATPRSSCRLRSATRTRPDCSLERQPGQYKRGEVYMLPKELDEEVALAHLGRLNVKLTKLTKVQADYLDLPVEGPYKRDTYRY